MSHKVFFLLSHLLYYSPTVLFLFFFLFLFYIYLFIYLFFAAAIQLFLIVESSSLFHICIRLIFYVLGDVALMT